jgi:hypothetical protein
MLPHIVGPGFHQPLLVVSEKRALGLHLLVKTCRSEAHEDGKASVEVLLATGNQI